ncbi:MAG: alkylhydroperoxidase-related (seleno)protein [Defluviicoccus sp.]|nr:alkylhydroperoxidase-related (seleno)protein [Defluviicoccus sp.]
MSGEMLSDLAPFAVRADLDEAWRRAWDHLARPGTWWTGAERLAMVAACREAPECALCRQRAAALSPFAVDGTHDSTSTLPDDVVEAIHRIRTDSGRLTEAWLRETVASGLSEPRYVEIVGVVSIATALDTLAKGLGLPRPALPGPVPGEPSRYRPAGARRGLAWLPILEPEDIADGDPNPYGDKTPDLVANIHRGMSLVPAEVAAFFDLDDAIYLPQFALKDFATEYRAISHAQMELLAARVSMINRCRY